MGRSPARALLVCLGMLAAPVAAAGEEECIFDQEAQLRHYRDMERRIAGARFDEAEERLVVERGVETITVERGGCMHFGVRITRTGPLAPGDAERDAVFARAVALVEDFGNGELVSADEVAEAIRKEAFELAQDGFCYLRVPGVEVFSIMWSAADGRLTVEVGYYIN